MVPTLNITKQSDIFIPEKTGTSMRTTHKFNESYLSPNKLQIVIMVVPVFTNENLVLNHFEQLLFNQFSPIYNQFQVAIHHYHDSLLSVTEFPMKFEKTLEKIAKIYDIRITRQAPVVMDSNHGIYLLPSNHQNLIYLAPIGPTQNLTVNEYNCHCNHIQIAFEAIEKLGVD